MLGTVISLFSLAISISTAWLTLFHRGQVKMTRPTMISLVQDGLGGLQKTVIRSLIYCTSRRGQVIENLYATLSHDGTSTLFGFWSYGENTSTQRGGGLFVGREGVALYHHFVLLSKADSFAYEPGEYQLEVFAIPLGEKAGRKVAGVRLNITEDFARGLNGKELGMMFNWNPLADSFFVETSRRPQAGSIAQL